MKNLLLLMFALHMTNVNAATFNSLKPDRVATAARNFMHKHLPTWGKVVVSVAMIATLLSAGNLQAQDEGFQEKVEEKLWQEVDNERYFSVLQLVLDFFQTQRSSHIVYLGKDNNDRALFLSLRLNILDIPHVQGRLLLDAATAYLADHNGLVLEDAKVEEVRAFISPDDSDGRIYDMSLLAVEGLDTDAYLPLEIALYPKSGTELDLVSYHIPIPDDPNNWQEIFDAPLLQQKCVAGPFSPLVWELASNCALDTLGAGITAPVFVGDYLVAFGLIETKLVGITPVVIEHLSHALAVDAELKLPVTWGEIKNGRQW